MFFTCLQTTVDCIIANDGEAQMDETVLGWSDEGQDSKVDNMMRLINEEKKNSNSMFSGGATKADVVRMIKEAKEKNTKRKQKRAVGTTDMAEISIVGGVVTGLTDNDVQQIADDVANKLKGEFIRVEEKVNDTCLKLDELKTAITLLETNITLEVTQQILKMKIGVLDGLIAFMEKAVTNLQKQNTCGERSNGNDGNRKQAPSAISAGNEHPDNVKILFHQDVDCAIAAVLGDMRSLPMNTVYV